MSHLLERVRSFSHRFTQKNRTHRGQKNSGPSPCPSPEGKGSNHRDTPMANHYHLTPFTQHPSLTNHHHLTSITQHPSLVKETAREERIKPPSHDIYTVYSWQIDNILLLLHRFSEWKLRGACLFGLAEIIPIDLIRIMPS